MHAPAAITALALGLSGLLHALASAAVPNGGQEPAPALDEPHVSALPGPGKQQPIAGLHGFQSESRLIFYQPADAAPQRLECCEAFPDRARWCLQPFTDASTGQRLLQYRYGEQAYETPVSQAKSVEVLGLARLDQLLGMELRHALFLFPDGYEWKQEGRIARVDLGAKGTLVATLDESGRPTSISSLTALGEIRDSYKELVWQTIDGRTWPASASLYHANGKIWDEQVLTLNTNKRFLDWFFLPPDLRARSGATGNQLADVESVQAIRLRPAVRKRIALDLTPTWSWEDVLARSADLEREVLAKLGAGSTTLEAAYYYELGKNGEPATLYLHLAGAPPADGKLPEGFESIPAREAFSLFLPSVDRLGAVALDKLVKAAGDKAARAGAPVVRVPASDPLHSLSQLVLPLQD